MRLVAVDSVPLGATLAQDVLLAANPGPPLLRQGTTLGDRYVAALRGKGVRCVWIEDELSDGVTPARALTPETHHRAINAVGVAIGDAREALAAGRGLSPQAMQELRGVAELIAREVHGAPDVAVHLVDMLGAEAYLLQHVVEVTALGTVLAARLFREHGWTDWRGTRRRDEIDPRLAKIALGLLLHDIGKLAIPAEVLDKPGALDEAEWELVRAHPAVGAEMLGEGISFLIRAVVRQHHERWDGSGYPDGVAGARIHQFARIAAVADVYDAVTSERVYRRGMRPHEGVALIEEGDGTQFDSEVVAVFRRVVMPFPPGTEVVLADGRRGLVAAVDHDAPYEPTVRVRDAVTGAVTEVERAPLAPPART